MIQVTEYKAFRWNCSLCEAECTISDQRFHPGETYTYGCVCGRIYRLTRGRDDTVSTEEDTMLERIFSVRRSFSSLAVYLVWNEHKGAWVTVESGGWRKALDEAMGICWRMYGDEIIKHIRESKP